MPTIRDPDPDESDGEYEPSDDEGDQLTLEDLKFFTRLEQATDDLELTELDETESQEVTAGKKPPAVHLKVLPVIAKNELCFVRGIALTGPSKTLFTRPFFPPL